jgi:hypothetical protein
MVAPLAPPRYGMLVSTIHAEHLLSNEPPEGSNAIDPAPAAAESSKKKKPDVAATSEAGNKVGHRAGLWTAAGIGIGSAAIAAALIYANRAKHGKGDA